MKSMLRNPNPISKIPESPWHGYSEGALRRGSRMERRGAGGYALYWEGLSLGCYPVHGNTESFSSWAVIRYTENMESFSRAMM